MLPLLSAPLLALAAAPARAEDGGEDGGGAVVEADHVELVQGVLTGEGSVRARFGQAGEVGGEVDLATAERFRLDLGIGLLVLEDGTWTRGAVQARFGQAEIDVRTGGGLVEAARLDVAATEGSHALHLRGDALQWAPDGGLSGRGLRLTTCSCEHPPWEVQAREATVVRGQEVRFRGGLVRLCGLPVLPLPAGRVPLADRRSGLLPPELGWGRDGLLVGLPAYLVLGRAADLTMGPELRTARGARLLAEGRWSHVGGGGEVRAAGGWDGVDQATSGRRGALDLGEGFAFGPWRLGVDSRIEGDRRYLQDYGDAFLSRGRPFAESLVVAALGPLRLEHDSFQALGDAGPQGQRLGAAVARWAGRRLGPVAVDGGARVDLVGEGDAAWALAGSPAGRVEADLGGRVGRDLGPVRLEGAAVGLARSWSDGQPWGEGRLSAAAWLPTWAELGRGRLVGEVGLRGGAARTVGTPDLRLWEDRPDPAWSLGPAASGRLVLAGGVPLSAGGWLALSDQVLAPTGWLRLDQGAWGLGATVDPHLEEGHLAYDDDRLHAGTGLVHSGDLLQSRSELDWTLPGRLSQWRPGYAAHLDLSGARSLSQGPRLRFSSRCGCLDAALAASWSADRSSPELRFSMQVR